MAEATGTSTTAVSSIRPALVVALSILLLSAMDALIKSLGPTYPILQLVWLRYAAGLVFAAVVFAWTRPHRINLQSLKANGLRTAVMMVAAGSFFYAITRMPLVEAVTLSFTAPIFMILIARVVLGEPITSRAIFAVGIGFAGVLVVVVGDMGTHQTLKPVGIAAALTAAVAYALGIVLLRKHAAHDAIPVLVFLQAAMATVFLAPFGIVAWSGIDTVEIFKFAVIGLLGTVGHVLIAWGFKYAEASRLAPLEYTNLLWAAIFGILFFNEQPAIATVAGAVLIILACLVATRPGWPIFPRRRMLPPRA